MNIFRHNALARILVLALAFAAIVPSCKKKDADYGSRITGSWHLTAMSTQSGIPDVYLDFTAEMNVTVYQKLASEAFYKVYKGTYFLEGKTLDGKYSDGTPFGSSYRLEFSDGGKTLKMTAQNGSGEVLTYAKTVIPENALASHDTKGNPDGNVLKPIL